MNPLTNVKNLNKLNENEIKLGAVGSKTSWHNQYRDSAWCFFGGMPFELTEGDIICIFSQYGEVVNLNLVRDKKTGKSRGFGFVCYENQLSTDLAVDNFNGTKILGRILRVDHAGNYRPPKEHEDEDQITKFLREAGCKEDLTIQDEGLATIKREKDEDKLEKKDGHKNRQKSRSRSPSRRDRDRDRDGQRERDRYRDMSRDNNRDRDRDRNKDNNGHRKNYYHSNR